MSKRKVSFDEDVESPRFKKSKEVENVKKHSLDSDEEDDNNDVYNVMNEDDIEGNLMIFKLGMFLVHFIKYLCR